jgi:hypothetical protein
MIVGNIKSPQDLQSKKTLQSQLLDLEIANEAELERRVRDYKNPNKPIPIAPEYKTNAELQKDRLAQEKQAITNMTDIGFDYNKSAELVAWLSSSTINKLVEFNANFKGIKKELTETTNPKLINTEFLKNYLEKYFEDIDVNYGRKFSKDSVSSNAPLSVATIDELHGILPSIETLVEIEQSLGRTYGNLLSIIKIRQNDIDITEQELEGLIIPDRDVRDLGERQRREYIASVKGARGYLNNLIDDIKRVEELLPKVRIAEGLFRFYGKLLPSDAVLNLIKQSLTQQERADMIRRYIGALRQAHILTRDGTNELYEELLNEDNIASQGYLRWVNKAIKALSFITNEAGVSKITKLQRDYEIVLNQNGKVGEYEQLKEWNNVREREVASAKAMLKDAMEDIKYELKHIRDEGDERFEMMAREQRDKTDEIQADRENAVAQINYRQQLKDSGQVAPDFLESMKQVSKDIRRKDEIGLRPAKNILEIDNALKRDINEDDRRGALNDKVFIWGQIQLNFLNELRGLYARDAGTAIATMKDYIDDNLGLTEKQRKKLFVKPRDEPNNEYFNRLIDAIKDFGDDKIRTELGDIKAFEDYDIDENLTKALIKTSRGQVQGETQYGLGMKRRGKGGKGINEALSKHFKEDEGDMRETIKLLRKHRKNEKKIDDSVSDSDSDSDTPAKEKAGVGFRHKKIKVGRGIEARQTPSYLSFGKYVIHMGHLLDKNVANFKHRSLGSIPTIKPLTISDDYKDFILDTIDNQKPNERLFNKLPQDEQKHFERVVSGAGLTDVFKLKRSHTEQERKDSERFELLRGEVMAGNNSEKVLKELRGLIVRFINEGRLHQREGTNLLMEISAL